jgi:hypothetical protein
MVKSAGKRCLSVLLENQMGFEIMFHERSSWVETVVQLGPREKSKEKKENN